MACGDSTYVSGSYLGTVQFPNDSPSNTLDIGKTDDGFQIEISYSSQEITTDQFGDSVVDAIYRGGNCFINMTLIEFNSVGAARLRKAFTDNGLNVDEGRMGTIGCTVVDGYDFILKLTRQSPINATNSFNTYLFQSCMLDPNFPVQWNMNSRLWALPLRVRAFPYYDQSNTVYRWYQAYDS